MNSQFLQTGFFAAQSAGKILIDSMGRIRSLDLKQKNDYVSNVDIEAEHAIMEIILSSFPDHNIIAEESDSHHSKSPYTWIIDPISSTVNYIHSLPHFAVSIALEEDNIGLAAVVFDPFYNELFWSEKDGGSYLNGSPIVVSAINDISKSLLCVGIHDRGDHPDIEGGLSYLRRILSIPVSTRRLGSTALEMCYVACGRMDARVNNHSDPYSIPAGKLIVEGAGGVVTDFNNVEWNADAANVVASNGKFHDDLIKLL
ncbi:inositol monophosphatase [Candidatus Uhrbacteria bacterium]|nr:inositol monophosphatase [Candidatus Uhrbacteria bacterium]